MNGRQLSAWSILGLGVASQAAAAVFGIGGKGAVDVALGRADDAAKAQGPIPERIETLRDYLAAAYTENWQTHPWMLLGFAGVGAAGVGARKLGQAYAATPDDARSASGSRSRSTVGARLGAAGVVGVAAGVAGVATSELAFWWTLKHSFPNAAQVEETTRLAKNEQRIGWADAAIDTTRVAGVGLGVAEVPMLAALAMSRPKREEELEKEPEPKDPGPEL
jgi:hypothetical protein